MPERVPITTPASNRNSKIGSKKLSSVEGSNTNQAASSASDIQKLDTAVFGAKDISGIYTNNQTRIDNIIDESGQ